METNVKFLIMVNKDFYEIVEVQLFIPELVLNLPDGNRTDEDWYRESFADEDLFEFLPENLELCEETILFECLGNYSVNGYNARFTGEYDEETFFDIIDWSADVLDDKF